MQSAFSQIVKIYKCVYMICLLYRIVDMVWMHENAVYLIERCTFKSITYSCIQGNRMPNLDMLDFKDMDDKSSFDNGCGATFQGQFWYFGDDSKVSLTLSSKM